MKNLILAVLAIGALLIQAQTVDAAPIRVVQEWRHQNFAINGFAATSTARFDDTGIANVGTDLVLLDHFALSLFEHGVGQSFSVARFSNPPSLNLEGNITANYNNGVFQHLSGVNLGGAARVGMINPSTGQSAGITINIAGSELIVHFGFSPRDYRLHSTTLTVVPEPGSMLLLGTGAIGLAFMRRRQPKTYPR